MANNIKKHGHASRKGGYSTTYYSWRNMLTRVRNTSNKNDRKTYNEVTCQEVWFDFENFLRDMGERPEGTTLDRVDTTKGYTPENCRWADKITQSRNTKHQLREDVGVVWLKRDSRWRANIGVAGRNIYLGTYLTKEEALAARKAGEKEYW